ncbi:MAG TPA: glycerol-3-phosphate 1-O-acyltransferase PlsY [Burkholderiaceae bacterium]|jgi:glycerol-3-phosphate acyltransferase PlsY|nr:glycerol-3-phosphate 1-O-acyltransferase PlsY [Burkholderiaceae bacterium]
MHPTLALLAVVLGGYLLGSVSFAVLVSRLFGLADPRSYGSGNPGATNVLRSGSKVAALVTLIGDAGKGALAAWLVLRFGPAWGLDDDAAALTGLAAFVGHLYPLYHRFKGGKGVATFLGVVWVLSPWLGLGVCIVWLLVAVFFRYSSAASIASAVVAPFGHLFFAGIDVTFLALAAMAVLLLMRHRGNIAKLRAGTERKIGQKSAAAAPASARRGSH